MASKIDVQLEIWPGGPSQGFHPVQGAYEYRKAETLTYLPARPNRQAAAIELMPKSQRSNRIGPNKRAPFPQGLDTHAREGQLHEMGRSFSPGSPAEWLAGSHVTCNVQCLNGDCKRIVAFRLDRFPSGRPWSRVGRCLVCTECGAAGSVNIMPNWHDEI